MKRIAVQNTTAGRRLELDSGTPAGLCRLILLASMFEISNSVVAGMVNTRFEQGIKASYVSVIRHRLKAAIDGGWKAPARAFRYNIKPLLQAVATEQE